MKIGDRIYVRGYVDEIRKDTVIVRNDGGYFGTIPSEVTPPAQPEIIRCMDCKHYYYADNRIPQEQRYTCDLDGDRWSADSFCSFAERREDE